MLKFRFPETSSKETQISSEIEDVEKDLAEYNKRFRESKAHSTITDAESGLSRIPIKSNPKKLTFQNIEAIAIKKNGIRQEILKKVCGEARPGELTFIMGSSGAGKTTLLNILTGRNLKNIETKGEIMINGRHMIPNEMKKLSAYVQQDDVFIGMLTVKETLRFAAKLRSPSKLNEVELESIVDELLVMMSLKNCENTKVGSITEKGLSRGERKRLAFACEILTDPPILFCDEPTSGLDSFMAHQVVKALRQLTYEGKTVVCTIHQPSTSVFHMADQLILLLQGHVAYSGPASQVDQFFRRCGYPIPKFISTPDHFIRVCSHNENESEKEYTNRIEKIILEHESTKSDNSGDSLFPSSHGEQISEDVESFPRTWCCQFLYIFQRSTCQLYRDKSRLIATLIKTLTMSIVIGSCFFRLQIHRDYLPSFKGFAFMVVQMMHMFMVPAMAVFWIDYPVVVREFHANMYSPSAYYLARTSADTLHYLIFTMAFALILLGMANLPVTFYIVFHYMAINILLSLNASSIAHAFVAMCGDLPTAVVVHSTVVCPYVVFGGFLITYDAIPRYFLVLAWLSWYKYAFEAITIVFFESIGDIEGCTESPMLNQENCSNGPAFIKNQAFEISNLWLDYTVILAVLIFWKILGVMAFSWRLRRA